MLSFSIKELPPFHLQVKFRWRPEANRRQSLSGGARGVACIWISAQRIV